MTTLYVMIGPAGCGKSTAAEKIAAKENGIVVSSDGVREELYGDEAVQRDNETVFAICHDRIRDAIVGGFDVVFDATNIIPKHRKVAMNAARNVGCDKIVGVVYCGSLETCFAMNSWRDRNVPESVIENMYYNLHRFEPTLAEGFDCLVAMR